MSPFRIVFFCFESFCRAMDCNYIQGSPWDTWHTMGLPMGLLME